MDRGAWRAIVHGVAKSQTRLKPLSTTILYFVPSGPAPVLCATDSSHFIITITASLSAMLGSSRPQGSCSNVIYVALVLPSVCTLHAGVAFQRALSMFAFRTVRKIHPTVPAAVCDALFSKRELTATFSMLSGDLFAVFHPSPSQEDLGHRVPHALWGPLASPVQRCLRLPYMLGILQTLPTGLLTRFTLSALLAEPRVGKARAKRLEEDARRCRNLRRVYALLAAQEAITRSLSWLTQQRRSSQNITITQP